MPPVPSARSATVGDIEIAIGKLLRTGVILAATVVLAGAAAYLWRHGGELPAYHHFQGEPAYLRQVSSIVRAALTFDARGVIQLGLLLLIATPIARVVFSAYAFAHERDRFYVAVSLVVLAVLLYSLIGR